MYLVTQGKYRINQLGYDKRKGEYVYIHKGVEIWREKGDTQLLDYFNEVRANMRPCNYHELETFPVWNRYSKSCADMEKGVI